MKTLDLVEFVGGPYDGYQHQVSDACATLVEDAAVPVSVNTILAATGETHGPLLPCCRLALYHLQRIQQRWQYRFQGEMEYSGADNERSL